VATYAPPQTEASYVDVGLRRGALCELYDATDGDFCVPTVMITDSIAAMYIASQFSLFFVLDVLSELVTSR